MYLPYLDLNNDSGIVQYKIDGTSIEVVFSNGLCRHYLYTYFSAGVHNVERMKQLASQGDGLNSYIMRYCRNSYANRW